MLMAIVSVGILLMLPEGTAGNLIALAVAVAGMLIPDTLPFIDEIVVTYMAVKRFMPSRPIKKPSTDNHQDVIDEEVGNKVDNMEWD